MNYEEALKFIHSNFWQGSKPGLERTEKLLSLMGDPHKKLRFVHVAGTNGKGSFCAMLSSILIEAGYRVGTYTSPYILRFNERMKLNGVDIPDQTLAELTDYVRPFTEGMEEKPTEFELITAIGMEYFAREKCDIVVLECGMGGRLDSTNVIDPPILSVITGIALDHTAFLGDTVEKVAAEKAGIIKAGSRVPYCGRDKDAERVILDRARRVGVPCHLADRTGFLLKRQDLSGTVFDYKEYRNLKIPLLGDYQKENAQNVLCAVKLLKESGLTLSDEAVRAGLEKVRWPARYERVRTKPLILCDGGHNPEGVASAVESTKTYFKDTRLIVVTGVMADKDYRYIAKRLGQIASEVLCLTPSNPRALKAEEYAKIFREGGIPARAFPSPAEAIAEAMRRADQTGEAILCVGSLYMYGEILEGIRKAEMNA
ncbi:MAG: bifunctional folylpolyglutamate synthase/dihydrofolate synthase [Clostridia bacterium]|nr:bifunctional folylpolyglutamate synthase/dihydrofolate synthase [Clostridia bacterium]